MQTRNEHALRSSMLPYLVLGLGVLIASTAAILIRLAQQQGVPELTIGAGRMCFAVLILTPIAWSQVGHELRHLQRRDLLFGIGAGLFLGFHFASWVTSMAYTSVASSTALVTTNPLWVGIASALLFRERLGKGIISGIVLTLVGSGLIMLSDTNQHAYAHPLLGNALALVGALSVSGYFLMGRIMRQRLSLLAYIWLAYSTAACLLVLWVVATGQRSMGFSPTAYLILLALAIGPQLLGHTAFNWSLRHLSPAFVALAILGEPLGSALLAWQMFGESFAHLQIAGLIVLLSGIFLAARDERAPKPTSESVENAQMEL